MWAGTQGRQLLHLQWRPYRFSLSRELVTSQGAWRERHGWLLRLETADGQVAWGEAALPPEADAAPEAAAPRSPGASIRPPSGWTPGEPGDGTAGSIEGTCGEGGSAPQGDGRATAWAHPVAGGPEALSPDALPPALERNTLEALLQALPHPVACALGMALAELDGLGAPERGGWLTAPASARLLPAGEAALAALEQVLAERACAASRREREGGRSGQGGASGEEADESRRADGVTGAGLPFTVKWKVAAADGSLERRVLEALLARLPPEARLRLDANGGWDRASADAWADRLAAEPRLDWFEQPLPPEDLEGLERLAARVPVALDESLRHAPQGLARGWRGWQVRRPLAEGDPRALLAALEAGSPRLMVSTALETGIGRRFLHHLAGLQARGPTPTAPGLAPGWTPGGPLFSGDPAAVWEAAR